MSRPDIRFYKVMPLHLHERAVHCIVVEMVLQGEFIRSNMGASVWWSREFQFLQEDL